MARPGSGKKRAADDPNRQQPVAVGSDSELVAYDQFIDTQLHSARRQVRTVDIAVSLVTLAAGSLGFFLVAAVFDHWVLAGGLGTIGRWLALAIYLTGAVVYLWRTLLPLCIYRINPVYAAEAIERSKPSLKNSLINFLLLRRRVEELPASVFAAIEEHAATELAQTPVEASIDRSHLIQAGYVLLGLLLLGMVYKVASPKDPVKTIGRIMAPWADISRPTRVSILAVSPGNSTVMSGQPTKVTAEIRGLTHDQPVQLLYSTADDQIADRVVPMLVPTDGYLFECQLPEGKGGIQQDLVYRVVAGDATSNDYRLRVQAAPTIVVEQVDYAYPSYTGMVAQTVDHQGDLKAIEGTEVTLHAVANQPIKTAVVDFDCNGTDDVRMTLDDRKAWATIRLALKDDRRTPQHTTYQLRFTNTDGHENPQPIRHQIEVSADIAPEIQILAPKQEEIELPLNARLACEISAHDPDFALSRVGLTGRSGMSQVLDRLLLDPTKDKPWPGQFQKKPMLSPQQLGLKVGDVLEYWAWAEDNKAPAANRTETTHRRARIIEPKKSGDVNPDAMAKNEPSDEKQEKGEQDKQGNGQPDAQNNQDQNDEQADQPPGGEKKPGQDKQEQGKQGDDKQPGNESGQGEKMEDRGGDQEKNQDGQAGGEQGPQGQQQSGSGQDKADDKQQGQDQGQSGQGQDQGQSGQGQEQSGQGQSGQGESGKGQSGKGQSGKGQSGKGGQGQEQSGGDSAGDGQSGGDAQAGDSQSGNQGRKNSAGSRTKNGQSGKDRSGGKSEPVAGDGTQDGEAFERILQRQTEQEQGGSASGGGKSGSKSGKSSPEKSGAKSGDEKMTGQDSDEKTANEKGGTDKKAGGKEAGEKRAGQQGAGENGSGEKSIAEGEKKPGAGQTSDEKGAGDDQQPAGENRPGADGKSGQPAGGSDEKNGSGDEKDAHEGGASGKSPGKTPDKKTRPEKTAGQGGQSVEEQPTEETPMGQGSGSQNKAGDKRGQQRSDRDKTGGGQTGDREHRDDHGEPGAGQGGDEKQGAPSAQNDQRGTKKTPGSGKSDHKSGSEPQSAGNSSHQSDSKSDQGGDRQGGGKQGGGQKSQQPGQDNPGSHSPADDGGEAMPDESGEETSGEAGTGKQADGKTGQSGKQPGQGSKSTAASKSDTGKSGAGKPGSGSKNGSPSAESGDKQPGSGNGQAGAAPGTDQDAKKEIVKERSPTGPPAKDTPGGPPGGAGTASGREDAPPPEPVEERADAANLEFARKTTELSVQRMRDQLNKGQVDQELLDRLQWTKTDMERWVSRWEEMFRRSRQSDKQGQEARRELDASLRSLGLRDQSTEISGHRRDDTTHGMKEGRRTLPPAEYRDQVRQYTQGISRTQPAGQGNRASNSSDSSGK